jgi:hypothetical protein
MPFRRPLLVLTLLLAHRAAAQSSGRRRCESLGGTDMYSTTTCQPQTNNTRMLCDPSYHAEADHATLCVPLYKEVEGQCHDIIAMRQVSGEADALAVLISPSPGAEPVLGRFNDELAIPPVLSGSPPGNVSPALCLPSR